jgi:hypothetical protein
MHEVNYIKLFLRYFKIPLSEMRCSWFTQNSSYFALLYYEKKMCCWYNNAGNGRKLTADVLNIKTKSGIYFKRTHNLYNKITAVF